jgi:dTDP-4-amino-4,6-dideoxygalactose transaminase
LSVKLRHLADWTVVRRRNAALYRAAIRSPGLRFAEPTPCVDPVYHLFVVEVANREEVMDHLATCGIASGIHYPIPLHLQPALSHLGLGEGAFPVTESLARRVLSLPMCANLRDADVRTIATAFDQVARP